MSTDWKALCAELLAGIDGDCHPETQGQYYSSEAMAAIDRARTALSQPEPPAHGEVSELVALIRQIALAWEPDACLLGNMTAGQLARAADLLEHLAQPEPVGSTDEELLAMMPRIMRDEFAGATPRVLGVVLNADSVALQYARAIERAVLARYGRPTIKPVPMSERPWEREGWCDAEGRCYGWDGNYWWMIGNPGCADETITHWLPASALPLPAAPGEGE